MKNLILIVIAIFAVTGCGQKAHSNTSKQSEEAIYVLFENGGTVTEEEQEDAKLALLHLFQQFSTLARRKATKHIQINLVLSALPNRIAWSGTPQQLVEQTEYVTSLITFKPTFSDLVVAFDQIETTVNLSSAEKIRLYWIGSTVNVPFQKTDEPIDVEVPQAIPENLALERLVPLLTTLKIMRVHPDQDSVLQAYLTQIGVMAKARAHELDFALWGAAQTKANQAKSM